MFKNKLSIKSVLYALAILFISIAITACPPPTGPGSENGTPENGGDGNGGGSSQSPGTIQGVVRDASTNVVLENVSVKLFDGFNVVASTTSDSNGEYNISHNPGTYILEFTRTDYTPTYYNSVVISENITTYLETLLQISTADSSGTGTASGIVSDALSGIGVEDVVVKLRSGINTTTGTIVENTTTNSSGEFTFIEITPGNYTAEFSKSGYNTSFRSLLVLGGVTIANQNTSLAPEGMEDMYRVILTWGEHPRDLDSHMTGPDGSGTRFHVFYASKGSGTSTPFTELDHDDTTSYGPETITIYQKFSGDYYYYVHDYTNRNLTSSSELANSGATVAVYKGSTLRATFYVPNLDGTLWKVFKLNGDTITPINQMLYEASPSNVSSRTLSTTSGELDIFKNLPIK